jgi:hypothetical protein
MHTMFKPSGLARRRPARGRSGADRQGRRARADDRGDGLDDPRSPPKEALRQYCEGVMGSSSRASAHAPATAASAARADLSASVKLATHNGVQWDRAKAATQETDFGSQRCQS